MTSDNKTAAHNFRMGEAARNRGILSADQLAAKAERCAAKRGAVAGAAWLEGATSAPNTLPALSPARHMEVWDAGYEAAHLAHSEIPAWGNAGSMADDLLVTALEAGTLRKAVPAMCASTDVVCVAFVEGAVAFLSGLPTADHALTGDDEPPAPSLFPASPMPLTVPAPIRRRASRWAFKGADMSDLCTRAADAFTNYDNGCGIYSSGYEAGQHHDSALPAGSKSTDRRVRAWGDFLIDLGEALAAIAPPAAPEAALIAVTYTSIDGARRRSTFKTLAGARRFAAKWVGSMPSIGSDYAVTADGIGKVTVTGADIGDLFIAEAGGLHWQPEDEPAAIVEPEAAPADTFDPHSPPAPGDWEVDRYDGPHVGWESIAGDVSWLELCTMTTLPGAPIRAYNATADITRANGSVEDADHSAWLSRCPN